MTAWPTRIATDRALAAVARERDRQEQLGTGRPEWKTCADPSPAASWKLAVLVEEVGEVARALNEDEPPSHLRAELIQVAAVAVAWVEALDHIAMRGTR